MNKKIKIIDLLNKIANGEELPKIKYDKHILKYNKDEKRFIDDNRLNSLYEIDFSELNDEVEILDDEEDKDIPLIPELELFTIEHNMKGCTKEDQINFNFRVLKEKINQIVEELNKRQ